MFSALDRISLDEINSQARMMTRFDRKYLLRHEGLENLVSSLPTETQVLHIGGTPKQQYRTTYFDTPERTSYLMAARRRRRQFKIRQRTYLSTGTSFCEIKTKGPRGVTVKKRVPISTADAHGPHIAADATAFALEELGPSICNQLHRSVENTYTRVTLRPPGIGRATIDMDLCWTSATGEQLSGLDLIFIETKSGAQPGIIDQALWSDGHRPVKVSKFGTGLAALHPELPANKWHRTLSTYFR